MKPTVSIAIETSCGAGGVALGLGDELAATIDFDASARHATQLVTQLDRLLGDARLRPADLEELYVSAGPGSFTGLRVGITTARSLAQAIPQLRCAAVPTPAAIAENARPLDWENLAVIMDARHGRVYRVMFTRAGESLVQSGPPAVTGAEQFLRESPRPLMLLGEGLAYHDLRGPGITIPGAAPGKGPPHLPTAANVWRVGRRIAAAGGFVDYRHLLPIYSREPEAVRLWERRHGLSGEDGRKGT